MPARLDRDTGGDAAAGKKVEHRRARKRQRADQPLDQFFRLLRRMTDALLRIAVEPRDLPDIGRVDALLEALRVEPLVALVELEDLRIERLPDRVEVEIVFRRLGKPGDLLVPVRSE